MDSRGNLVLFGLIGFIGLGVLVALVLFFFPEASILMRILLIFGIFMAVRGSLGDGTPTILISAILIYFLAFKYFYVAAGFYVVYFLISFTGTTLVSFGLRYFLGRQ